MTVSLKTGTMKLETHYCLFGSGFKVVDPLRNSLKTRFDTFRMFFNRKKDQESGVKIIIIEQKKITFLKVLNVANNYFKTIPSADVIYKIKTNGNRTKF